MEDGGSGSIQWVSKKLREEFDAAFIEEIVPGIVHNFANPLNGIMGRSSLMQRRMEDRLKMIAFDPEERESPKYYQGVMKDIETVSHEAERLSDMLREISEKFMAVIDTSPQRINLSELLSLEMQFFEFHLDFKHNVKKTLNLDSEIPEITGSPADYVLLLSAIIRHAIRSMEDNAVKELAVSTGLHNGFVTAEIGYNGMGSVERRVRVLTPELASDFGEGSEGGETFGTYLLMKKYKARVRVVMEGDWVRYIIEIPTGDSKEIKDL